ncbi:MAG: glycosyl transferase family 1, partial [Nitrospirae bacterium]|nr:glycosyl transferase family 1 [Nitrospirota bacterium]
MIADYASIAPKGDLLFLRRLAARLKDRSFLHVNSTKAGGGVAEILQSMIPILTELGISARWEVIEGDERFFEITKKLHNALQGSPEKITKEMWDHHFDVNRRNAERLDLDADAVLIHDPQPVPLIEFKKRGTWVWRCHIDVSNPMAEVCDRLTKYCEKYDAAIFSVSKFARARSEEH